MYHHIWHLFGVVGHLGIKWTNQGTSLWWSHIFLPSMCSRLLIMNTMTLCVCSTDRYSLQSRHFCDGKHLEENNYYVLPLWNWSCVGVSLSGWLWGGGEKGGKKTAYFSSPTKNVTLPSSPLQHFLTLLSPYPFHHPRWWHELSTVQFNPHWPKYTGLLCRWRWIWTKS